MGPWEKIRIKIIKVKIKLRKPTYLRLVPMTPDKLGVALCWQSPVGQIKASFSLWHKLSSGLGNMESSKEVGRRLS